MWDAWLIAVLVVILSPFVAYGWWIVRAMRARRWRKVGWQVGIPVVVTLLGMGTLRYMGYRERIAYWEGIFGEGTRVDAPLFAYHSERAFNGDGVSVEEFLLPVGVVERVGAMVAAGDSIYPRRPSYRSDWRSIGWVRGPRQESHARYLECALEAVRIAAHYDPHFARIGDRLRSADCLYALFYNATDEWVGDVDLFLIDPTEGRFYRVNLNT